MGYTNLLLLFLHGTWACHPITGNGFKANIWDMTVHNRTRTKTIEDDIETYMYEHSKPIKRDFT